MNCKTITHYNSFSHTKKHAQLFDLKSKLPVALFYATKRYRKNYCIYRLHPLIYVKRTPLPNPPKKQKERINNRFMCYKKSSIYMLRKLWKLHFMLWLNVVPRFFNRIYQCIINLLSCFNNVARKSLLSANKSAPPPLFRTFSLKVSEVLIQLWHY